MHSHLRGHPALIEAVRRLEHLKPDQFELYFTRKAATKIDCKNQEVDSLSRAEDVGLAIRLVRDRRLGFSYTTSMENEAIDRAVRAAWDIAQVMPADEANGLHSFGQVIYPEIDQHDAKGLAAPIERKIELARRIEAECKAADPRITGVRSAALAEVAHEIHMVDSHGEHIHHRATLFTASIACKAEQDGDSQMGSEFGFSHELDGLDPGQVGRQAAVWATELLKAGPAPTLKCPAVFRNQVVADLLEFLAPSFSAEEIAKGRSMLAGQEGQRLFSEKVTLVDDGLLPGGYATSPFDGEGVPSTRTPLVEGGFLKGALYDGYQARKRGRASTGSAVRGIKAPPTIGASNLYMVQGKRPAEQLLDGIDRGVLITDLMGVHTANPVTGDFSLGASGILIERGKLTRPIKGFAVAGNVLELFRQMTDIGSDLRFFGSVGAPSVRVAELSVGGS
jgi:PmbA protein